MKKIFCLTAWCSIKVNNKNSIEHTTKCDKRCVCSESNMAFVQITSAAVATWECYLLLATSLLTCVVLGQLAAHMCCNGYWLSEGRNKQSIKCSASGAIVPS